MMVALKVMAYFKISLSTRNWDRAFFISPLLKTSETCHQRSVAQNNAIQCASNSFSETSRESVTATLKMYLK